MQDRANSPELGKGDSNPAPEREFVAERKKESKRMPKLESKGKCIR